MARIYRDDLGIPHVRGTSALDVAHGQGLVTARDRTWQLEHLRRRAAGTTADLLGPGALAWDVLARRSLIERTAERMHAALDAETTAFLAAYVAGVQEGLDAADPTLGALGATAQPWQPWTPLSVFLAQHLLFGTLGLTWWEHEVRTRLGREVLDVLAHEPPHPAGSNAWAVGPGRTASGAPLVAGDPHRTFEAPGVYQQVRLCSEDPADPFDVVGFAFPGVPGVPHFAHAGGVAWAITNACGSYQDLFAERLRRVGAAGVEALGPDGWEPAEAWTEVVAVRDADPVEVPVVVTARGPVLHGGPDLDEGAAVSLRHASQVAGDLGFPALLALLRARDVGDVDAALDGWVEPVNNVVMADRAGRVRYRVAGLVPVRAEANRRGIVPAWEAEHAWHGWLRGLPAYDVAADGVVVTANERRGPESDPIGASFAAPHRARRIAALLEGRDGLDVADQAAVHADVQHPHRDLVHDLLAGLDEEPLLRSSPEAVALRAEVLGWDGRSDPGSTGAAAFAQWRRALVGLLVASPPLAGLADLVAPSPVLAASFDSGYRVGLALETLLRRGAPLGLDLPDLAGRALVVAAREWQPGQTWGEGHTATWLHGLAPAGPTPEGLPAPAVPGDQECVCCTGSTPATGDAAWRGSVARYVWDLADVQGSGWVVPLGAHGDPASPHAADQTDRWARVALAPVVTDWARLRPEE